MERFQRLAHSIWDCKYHIVWIPKYRRKDLYGSKRAIVVDTIRQWARIKGVESSNGDNKPTSTRANSVVGPTTPTSSLKQPCRYFGGIAKHKCTCSTTAAARWAALAPAW